MKPATVVHHKGFQPALLDGVYFDSLFIIGVFALAMVSGLVVTLNPALFVPVMLVDLWFLGYHHVISTFTKLVGTREDRQQNFVLLYPLPLLLLAIIGSTVLIIGIVAIVTIYLFWQWFHYTRQSWGIAAFYKRKAGIKPSEHPALDQAVFWMIPLWGILNRCAQGWDEFLFLPVWMPAVPAVIAQIAGVFAIASLVLWIRQRYRYYCEGTLSVGLCAFELSHFAIFTIGYVIVDELNTGWLIVNIWHNAQYILFVWLYNTNRFKRVETQQRGVMPWLSQKSPFRIFTYFLFCIVITTLVYTSILTFSTSIAQADKSLLVAINIVIFQSINFHHYVVDSIIWKTRNKTNQQVMNVA